MSRQSRSALLANPRTRFVCDWASFYAAWQQYVTRNDSSRGPFTIYCLRVTYHRTGDQFFKIGFTRNLRRRLSFYRTSYPAAFTVDLLARHNVTTLRTAEHRERSILVALARYSAGGEWFQFPASFFQEGTKERVRGRSIRPLTPRSS